MNGFHQRCKTQTGFSPLFQSCPQSHRLYPQSCQRKNLSLPDCPGLRAEQRKIFPPLPGRNRNDAFCLCKKRTAGNSQIHADLYRSSYFRDQRGFMLLQRKPFYPGIPGIYRKDSRQIPEVSTLTFFFFKSSFRFPVRHRKSLYFQERPKRTVICRKKEDDLPPPVR